MSAIEAAEGFDIMRLERDRTSAVNRQRIFRVGLGTTLVLVGALPLGRLRGLFMFVGAGVLLRELSHELSQRKLSHAPRPVRHVYASLSDDLDDRDAVDEASWQSFPASDPPSY